MSIKDILVHVDASPASDQRIQLACRLAHRFGAHLTGLSIRPRLDWFAMPPESGAAAVAVVSWLDDLIAATESLGKQFKVFLKSNGVAGGAYGGWSPRVRADALGKHRRPGDPWAV